MPDIDFTRSQFAYFGLVTTPSLSKRFNIFLEPGKYVT